MTDTTELRRRIDDLEAVAGLAGGGGKLSEMIGEIRTNIDNLQTAVDRNIAAIDIITASLLVTDRDDKNALAHAIHTIRDGYEFKNLRSKS